MKKDKWIWMPHAGHFICGHMCRFHLATYVGKYIVSTVGEMWLEESSRRIHARISNPEWYAKNMYLKGDNFDSNYMEEFGFEELGAGRKYETMVFEAKREKNYLCCPYVIKSGKDLDFIGYIHPEEAYKGHLKMCNKWSK